MRNAHKLLLLIGSAALAACQQKASDQSIAVSNNTVGADIEALPPDESSATPTDELANGDDNADVNEADDTANSL